MEDRELQERQARYHADQIRAGEIEAGYEGLKKVCYRPVLAQISRMLANYNLHDDAVGTAEHITEEVFEDVVMYIMSHEVEKSIRALIYYIARGKVWNIAQKRQSEYRFEHDIPEPLTIDPKSLRFLEELDVQDMLDDLRIMEVLSPCQRVALILRHWYDLPPRTITLLMGRKESVISSSITQAKNRLRDYTESYQYQLKPRKTETGYRAEIFTSEEIPYYLRSQLEGVADTRSWRLHRSYFFMPVALPFKPGPLYYFIHTGYMFNLLVKVEIEKDKFYVTDMNNASLETFKSGEDRDTWLTRLDEYKEKANKKYPDVNLGGFDAGIITSPEILDAPNIAEGIWLLNSYFHKTEQTRPAAITIHNIIGE